MRVLDLFCGCGGISAGFQLAGFEIVAGIDHDLDSTMTFSENFPSGRAICDDLLSFDEGRIIQEFQDEEIDVIVGGPPCQGFSPANRWQKDSEDPRNLLFLEFLRFVRVLKPKVVVIENVRGILSRDQGYVRFKIIEHLAQNGFDVVHEVLNASDFGVPQNRLRTFFVATELGLPRFDFGALVKRPKVTVGQAIGDLYHFEDGTSEYSDTNNANDYIGYLRTGANGLPNHDIRYPAEITQVRISTVPQGGNWQCIPKDLFPKRRNNRHSSAFKRLSENDQSVTIDTGNAHSNYFHPIYNRIPTVREAARLQSFQDRFVFLGSRTSQFRQVGNAVPPLLSKAIADQVRLLLQAEDS